MLRRAASGHIEATQLSKLAAASRIALAVISGWPEAPSSPLHCAAPPVEAGWVGCVEPVWSDFDLKILPRKSSGPLTDWANAGTDKSSEAARITAPVGRIGRSICRPIAHP